MALQPHLMVRAEDVGQCVLIPGDPKRVSLMSEHLEDAKKVGENRQFVSYTGHYSGVKTSIVSSGIGVPAMLITCEELYRCGCKVFVRVGTTGGLRKGVDVGDLVVANAAVRTDGGTQAYAPMDYPAVADRALTTLLVQECEKAGVKVAEGIVWTSDAYYAENLDKAKHWSALGAVSVEMECSGLFVFSTIKSVKAGAILVADGNLIYGSKRSEQSMDKAYADQVIESLHKATEIALRAATERLRGLG
ncbi:MAG: nucleoside phosphorylase [Thermoprotei archaeon]